MHHPRLGPSVRIEFSWSSVSERVELAGAAQLSGVGLGVGGGGGVGGGVGLLVRLGVGGAVGGGVSVISGDGVISAGVVGSTLGEVEISADGVSAPGVDVMAAIRVGVAVGDGLPPSRAKATTPASTSSTIAPTATGSRRFGPPSLPDAAAAAGRSVCRRSPHLMQKRRPAGLRVAQFQQMTSGARLTGAVVDARAGQAGELLGGGCGGGGSYRGGAPDG